MDDVANKGAADESVVKRQYSPKNALKFDTHYN